MIKYYIVLIAFLVPLAALAEPCNPEESIVVLAPQPGVRTLGNSIAVRGFFCHPADFVIIENRTTDQTILGETFKECFQEKCLYYFATLVRKLAPGNNELVASPPNGAGKAIQVIRSSLVQNQF